MKKIETEIEGAVIIEPDVFGDKRGFFLETYNSRRYEEFGIDQVFVQDNISFSSKGTLRGLHFQKTHQQAKLVQVILGEIFDVAVDLRQGSSTYGKWTSVILSGENKKQFFVPEGFAHGFVVLSDSAYFSYKCSDLYNMDDEGGILWSDPDLGIDWPMTNPLVSDKDRGLKVLAKLTESDLPASAKGKI